MFEKYKRPPSVRRCIPYPSIHINKKNSCFTIGRLAQYLFVNHDRVNLYYDRKKKLVALEPTHEEEGSIALARRQFSTSVVAKAFIHTFKIPLGRKETRRYKIKVKKNMVIIDLKQKEINDGF